MFPTTRNLPATRPNENPSVGLRKPPRSQCADRAEKPSSSPQRDASGVDTVEFLGHPGGVIEHSIALRRDLATAIRHHRPELVVTLNHEDTWFGMNWNSPDHRNAGRAVLDAIGDAGNKWIFPELAEQGIEPWRGVRYVAISGASNPTHAVAIESGLERSIRSLEAHARYLEALGGPLADARTFLTANAEAAAERFGGRLAAAFQVMS